MKKHSSVQIRTFCAKDTKEVASLLVRTYQKFNSSEYFKKEAVKKYIRSYHPSFQSKSDLLLKFKRTPLFFVAVEQKKIIGMVRGTPERIANLFVESNRHNKGVGRALVMRFEKAAKSRQSTEIRIRSSLYAVPFYQRLCYKKTTGVRNFRGLKMCPMKKPI